MNDMRTKDKRGGAWWIAVSFALALVLVLAGNEEILGARAAPTGSPPELVDSFASSSVWPGQDWKIYVKGTDPNGQMDYIWVEISQLGGNMWSHHRIYLRGENRKDFEGYITLPTPHFFPKRSWEYVRIEMRIKDRAGQYSNKRIHELEIGSRTKEALPMEWRTAANNQLGTLFFIFDLEQGEHMFKR